MCRYVEFCKLTIARVTVMCECTWQEKAADELKRWMERSTAPDDERNGKIGSGTAMICEHGRGGVAESDE